VGDRHVEDHAIAGHPAPAVGVVPERDKHAHVDADELADGQLEGKPARALHDPVHQRRGQLRPRRGRPREAPVQHRHAQRLDDVPADGRRDRLGADAVEATWPEKVALAEHLGALEALKPHAPREHAVENEQPVAVANPIESLGFRPDAFGVTVDPGDRRIAGLHQVVRRQALAEPGVRVQYPCDRHAGRQITSQGLRGAPVGDPRCIRAAPPTGSPPGRPSSARAGSPRPP
jgi:hypothetical protein